MANFKKYILLPATPQEVYLALTIPQSIQLWTGAEVEFQAQENTEFSLWEGDIVGKNISFEQDKKIVQEWYFGEKEPSIVTIKLHEDKKGTSLEYSQTNIPDEDFKEFTQGIEEYFLGGLIDFFEIENI
ncbi:MAG: ATPase [Pedobacter sp.]|nr:MAG: ATPase [Pedobacter sp.]